MGKSVTPKYRVEYRDQKGWHSECWSGRATNERAEEWRLSRNKSFGHGGVNFHVSEAAGIILHVSRVLVINQRTGHVAADAKAPQFEAV